MENGTKHGKPDSIAHLTSHLGSLMRADNLCLMTDLPSFGLSDLQIGVPSLARHMVIANSWWVFRNKAHDVSALHKVLPVGRWPERVL